MWMFGFSFLTTNPPLLIPHETDLKQRKTQRQVVKLSWMNLVICGAGARKTWPWKLLDSHKNPTGSLMSFREGNLPSSLGPSGRGEMWKRQGQRRVIFNIDYLELWQNSPNPQLPHWGRAEEQVYMNIVISKFPSNSHTDLPCLISSTEWASISSI